MSDANDGRWWEQYYVRYFVGTVVGVFVIFILREKALLASEIATFVPGVDDIDATEFAAVALAGLAYCYVSSAPVLALHGVRGDWLRHGEKGRAWSAIISMYVGVVLLLVLAAFLADGKLTKYAVPWAGRILLFVYLVAQLILIGRALLDKCSRIASFYVRLANERAAKQNVGGYLDSYKHLREHGNAVMILVNEVSLGLILAAATSVSQLVCFVLLWSLPATSMWFVGTHLENHLSDGKSGLDPTKAP